MAKPVADLFLTESAFHAGIKLAVIGTSGVARTVDVKVKDCRLCVTSVMKGNSRDQVAMNMIEAKRLLDKSVSKMFSDGEQLEYQITKGHKNLVKLMPSSQCGYEVLCMKGGEWVDRAERKTLQDALIFMAESVARVFTDDHNKAAKEGKTLVDMTKISKCKGVAKKVEPALAAA